MAYKRTPEQERIRRRRRVERAQARGDCPICCVAGQKPEEGLKSCAACIAYAKDYQKKRTILRKEIEASDPTEPVEKRPGYF